MYLVTGASGNVGSLVVEQLLDAGHVVRAYVRTASKLAHLSGRIEIAVGDYATPDAFSAALEGVQGVFFMNIGGAESFGALVERACACQVERAVMLSTAMVEFLPETMLGRAHREKEDMLAAASLDARFVRPTGFMSNTLLWAPGIRADGVVANPMGTGRAAPIAPEDIAAVAVRALTDPGLTEKAMLVTGAETISVPEQVALLAQALGRPLRCMDITLDQAVENLTQAGVPQQVAASIVKSYASVREGRSAVTSETVERILGRKPLRFEQWVKMHADRFR
ncbi:NAD(P)H-binding protein [Trinickia sp. NRRL B-1857]|uniref:NAD(P)H-binding protein n=1 Tax=Trinickia sp. NRRL B-1857 TaxID=3162879 RepID=UPI003D28AAD6